jgi:hypothetical protein
MAAGRQDTIHACITHSKHTTRPAQKAQRTLKLLAFVVNIILTINGCVVCQPCELLHGASERDGLGDEPQSPRIENEQLDGVGEGQTHDGSTTILSRDGEKADGEKHDSAVEIAVEGDPEVERVGIKEGAVLGISSASEFLHSRNVKITVHFKDQNTHSQKVCK